VSLRLFVKEEDCEFCKTAEELLSELPPLSELIKLTVHNAGDADRVEAYGLDKFPAIVIEGETDYGIRFYGLPAGHEFTALIQTILMVGARDHGLSKKVMQEVDKINQPVHIQVMTTTACPYCPMAVAAAHRLAIANQNIRADQIETAEFPDIVDKYNVSGVPDTIINEQKRVVGAMPEIELAYFIQEALGLELSEEARDAIEMAGMAAQAAREDEAHQHEHHHHHDHEEGPPDENDKKKKKEKKKGEKK